MPEEAKVYHLALAPGDLAPFILTSGSPERIRRLAGYFEQVALIRQNREFLTITGSYQGIPVSGLATGIGPAATVIAIVEAVQCQPQATFIRVGSCGGLQPQLHLGDLIISTAARRLDGVTDLYAPPELPAEPDPRVTAALLRAVQELGYPYHCGLTCTTADFYHGQGRAAPGFGGVNETLLQDWQAAGVLNLEMEMAVYFTLARVCRYPIRAGGVTAVFADRCRNLFIEGEARAQAEDRLCRVGLTAVTYLHTEKE